MNLTRKFQEVVNPVLLNLPPKKTQEKGTLNRYIALKNI